MTRIQNEHRCGWVALMGPPNAGKSTLLNALLGQKISIVTSKPQTTRSRVVGIMSEPGAQVIFMDTAAHAVMLVLDSELYIRRPEFLERDIQSLRDALAEDERPLLVVVNKVDLFHDKSRMLPLLVTLQEYFPKAEVFPMSALTKDGLDELKKIIVNMMPEGDSQFPEDQLSTAPTRFLAAEIVREKVGERLRQEVPYTTAVDIEAWEEDPERDLTVIHAVIFVQRPSHKAMVIGRAGATIKEIGTEARRDIQKLIGGKVHLQLWVKVKDNWAEDTELLHDLGYENE